jgi:N-acetyl sugar amidotransferase
MTSLYGLPEDVKFCKKCVISNQRPNSTVEMKNKDNKKQAIAFDQHGICSACNYNSTKKEINWKEREEKLFELLNKYRRNDGSYDVLVPSSGGKDSSFTAHILKYKYKMNPLTITWAPNMFTDAGWNNLNNVARVGGVDGILYTPNGRLHQTLTRLAFKNLGHPFQPFIHGQKVVGPKFAKQFGIKLIMYGENQAEYGNSLEDNFDPFMKPDFFTIDDPKEMILGGERVADIMEKYNFTLNDFSAYIPPSTVEVAANDIKVSFLGFFEKWDPQECYYYAVENTGFKPAMERSECTYSRYTEIDDKIVPFHFYMMFIKFGIGRATYDAAQEIRNQKITRDEGVHLVRKFDGEFPQRYFKDFLEYLNMSESEFHQVLDSFRSPHLWEKNGKDWKLKHIVSNNIGMSQI